MKKTKKLLLLCALVVVLIAGLSISSMAATPTGISVQVCDRQIEFENEKPVEQNGRIYVPLRTFFESLGAKVSYYEATQTITATRGDTSASFTIGYIGMQTENASGRETIMMDAAPYFQNGSVMIPVRYAAEAFGCTVGWDWRNNTVLILDLDGLLEESGAKFTLMDKLLSSGRDKKNYALDGSFDMSITEDELTEGAIKVGGSFTGIQNSEIANMDMSFNFDSLIEAFGEDMTDEDKEMLKNFKIKAIANNNTGKMYMQADFLTKQFGITGDVWFLFDFSEYLPEGYSIMTTLSFEEYLKTSMSTSYLYSKSQLDSTVDSLRQIIAFCSDDSFEVSGNKYTNQKTLDADGIGYKVEMVVVNDKIVSYDLYIDQKSDYLNQNIKVTMDESKSFNFVMAVDSLGSKVEMTMKMKMTETSKTPDTQPKAGSVIIDPLQMSNMYTSF